jgi:hypothetical protein
MTNAVHDAGFPISGTESVLLAGDPVAVTVTIPVVPHGQLVEPGAALNVGDRTTTGSVASATTANAVWVPGGAVSRSCRTADCACYRCEPFAAAMTAVPPSSDRLQARSQQLQWT